MMNIIIIIEYILLSILTITACYFSMQKFLLPLIILLVLGLILLIVKRYRKQK